MLSQEQQVRIISPEQQFDFVALPGQTVKQLITQLPEWEDHESYAVYNHGQYINDIEGYIVNDGDRLVICMVPQGGGGGGGKGILGIVASIAIIAVAWWNPMGWAAAGGLLTTTSLYGIGAGLLLTSVGTMLAPKPELGTGSSSLSSQREANSYFITGQSNASRLYQPVLVAYGKNKIFPVLAANPNVINVGKDSTFDALYDFGIGEQSYDLSLIKFGDTLANQYNPTYYQHTNTKNPDLKLITNRFGYQDYSVRLDHNVPFVATTKDNTINAEVNIAFPRGLYYIDDAGNNQVAYARFYTEWRPVGGGQWTKVNPFNYQGALIGSASTPAVPCVFGQIYDYSRETYYDVAPTAYQLDGRTVKNVGLTSININGGNYQLLTYYEYRPSNFGSDWRYREAVLMEPGELWVIGQPTPAPPASRYIWQSPYTYAIPATASDELVVGNATSSPFVIVGTIIFPNPGTYEIRLTRTTPISTNNRLQDEATFTLLESRMSGNVLNLSAPHTMLEMRVKANERLSGVVQNLSVVCTSVLNTYDAAGNMVGRIATRNPAWIAIDILTGVANPRPIRHDQIDWPAWKRLADVCDEQRTWKIGTRTITSNRFVCDVVIDYETTIKQLLESVLSTCRSGLTIGMNGRYSVMFDGERTTPRQVITPSNSWNFTASRQFPPEVHALKVSFIDEGSDYKKQEVLVYSDGYNFDNSEKFEDVGTMGITTYQHAWAFGRYQMAAAINRSEVFTVTMDVENLACQRGDLVYVAHDVPMVGGVPSYVKSINGNVIEVTENLSSLTNSYTVRLSDGTIRQGSSVLISGNVFQLDNVEGIEPDDLIIFGEAERVVKSYLVSQITPSLDLSATLTLLPYIPGVYDADIGALPEWQPEISDDLINSTTLAITAVTSLGQELAYVDRIPEGRFTIVWEVNDNSLASSYDLVVITADGEREIFTGIKEKRYEYIIDLVKYPMKYGEIIFEVTPFTAGGIAGTPGSTIDVVAPDRTSPKGVNWFLVNVQDMEIALAWEPPQEPDIQEYEIRYSPKVVDAQWNASQLIGKFPYNVTRTMVGARTGTYAIVVRDTSGNISDVVGKRSTIESLPDINLIDTMNDAPDWGGTLGGIVLEGGNPQSAGNFGEVAEDGYYFYESIFDIGYIYELRIVNKIQSHGIRAEDLMINWVPLAGVTALARAKSSQFNAMLEVRTANEVNFIKDWMPLNSATPIGGANPDAWSIWRPCEVGDFTGRLFQFRIRLQSFDPSVKVVIDDGLIEIDVRDRIDRFNDLAVMAGGITVNFDPAFMEPPTLAITTENSQAVRYEITNKSRTAFDIDLFDQEGNPVAGQIDVLALGYGREKSARI